MAMSRRKEKEKRKKTSRKEKKDCYSTLEALVEELECNLYSLVDALDAEEAEINTNNIASFIWGFDQRLEFLKKLLCAEFASNPEKTKHLRHISDRIQTLEQVFRIVLDSPELMNQFDLADSLSLCSCSNYGDDDDDDDDDGYVVDDDDGYVVDDDDDYVLNKEKEVSCATTVEQVQNMVPPKNRVVVETKEEVKARKKRGRTERRSSSNKFANYWALVVMMVISFSGFFLFSYYRQQGESNFTRVIVTPT